MRYSYEFKRNGVELYRKGVWAETPDGISDKRFRMTIRNWFRLERRKGSCATQGEKAAIIKELRDQEYQLKHPLRVMKLAKSTYYYEISKEDAVEA